MANEEEQAPPRVTPKLKSAPKIRQLYWCDLPKDAQLPEFWKRRPVVILSKNATLFSTVTVIPCSTQAQPDPKFAFPLRTTIDGKAAWAVCDKPMTVAVSRLVSTHGAIVRIPQDEFDEMLDVVLNLLPKPPAKAPPPIKASTEVVSATQQGSREAEHSTEAESPAEVPPKRAPS